MNNINTKTAIWVILGISFAIFYGFYSISTPKPTNVIEFAKLLPKVISADLLLYFVFKKWLWRYKIFKGWLVPFSNLNGTWKGYIKSNWINPETGEKPNAIPVILTINQSFTKISCVMRTQEMASHSYIADFIIDRDNQVNRLSYSYISNPNQAVRERSQIHHGTMFFNIINHNGKKLVGNYWTERQTTGDIELEYWKKERFQEYPSELGQHPMNE